MNEQEIVRALRNVQEKHKNDFVSTFAINISEMARDCADCIESLQARLAEKEKERQDWQDDFNRLNEGGLKRIAALTARAEKAEAERDKAVEDITKYAKTVHTCIHVESPDCHVKDNHEWCARCPAWKYRGLGKE